MQHHIQKQNSFQALRLFFTYFLRVPPINFTGLPFGRIPMVRIPSEDSRSFF